jgi:hypothetical protein
MTLVAVSEPDAKISFNTSRTADPAKAMRVKPHGLIFFLSPEFDITLVN